MQPQIYLQERPHYTSHDTDCRRRLPKSQDSLLYTGFRSCDRRLRSEATIGFDEKSLEKWPRSRSRALLSSEREPDELSLLPPLIVIVIVIAMTMEKVGHPPLSASPWLLLLRTRRPSHELHRDRAFELALLTCLLWSWQLQSPVSVGRSDEQERPVNLPR